MRKVSPELLLAAAAVVSGQGTEADRAAVMGSRDKYGRLVRGKVKADPDLRAAHFRAVRGERKQRWRALMGGGQ